MSLVARAPSVVEYRRLRAAVGWSTAGHVQQEVLDRALCSVLAATAAGELVGMGRVVGDGVYGFLVDVAVLPSHQHAGVGRAVVQHLTEASAAQGVRHLAVMSRDVVPS